MRATHQGPRVVARLMITIGVLLTVIISLPRGSSAVDVTDDQAEYISDVERFPGWKGTLPGIKNDESALDPNRVRTVASGSLGQVEWSGEVQQLSWSPRLYLYKNFISDEECEHLITRSEPKMVKSEVVNVETGGGKLDDVRTSTGSYFGSGETPIVKRIEERIARASFIPPENGEGLQILRYINGQEYKPHHDFFWDKFNADPAHGGQRVITVLMYLSTPEEGGETVFPLGQPKSTGSEWSECAKKGLSVKATKGDAVLFYSLYPNGTTDLNSEHGSCPVLKGTKWSATKWIHVSSLIRVPEGCRDLNGFCSGWAKTGECTKNPGFMLENCRESCNACDPAATTALTALSGTGGANEQNQTHAQA